MYCSHSDRHRYNMEHSTRGIAICHIVLFLSSVVAFCLVSTQQVVGQTSVLSHSATFTSNEELHYKISFKWGIVRGRIGYVTITNRATKGGQYFSQLLMRTTGIAETFYSMRDTLETLYGVDKMPLRFEKRINDKGYYSEDISTFSYTSRQVKVNNRQKVKGEICIDTTFVFNRSNKAIIDLLSSLAMVRTYDFVSPSEGRSMRAVVPLADTKTDIEYVFKGFETIMMPDGSQKQAMKIGINVEDKNFNTNKNSVIVWLTRDKAQIPVRLQAELAIGAAVVELTDYYKK